MRENRGRKFQQNRKRSAEVVPNLKVQVRNVRVDVCWIVVWVDFVETGF